MTTTRWRATLGAVVLAVTLLAVTLLLPTTASAQEDGGGHTTVADGSDPDDVVHSWTLVPSSDDPERASSYRPNLSFDLAPGATVEDAVTVFNYGTVPLTFEVFATDARNNADGDFDLLPTADQPVDVGSWVTVAQRHVTVPAGGSATVPITVTVPADARPGDHVGALLASAPVTGTGREGQVITFDRRTGTRLYVRVEGDLRPALAATSVRTTYRPSLDPLGGTAVVTYRIENRGNVRLGAEHLASVSGPLGVLRERSSLGTIEELLPGEDVTVRTTIDGVAATGVLVTDVEVEAIPVGGGGDRAEGSAGALAAAPPWTLLAGAVAVALVGYARRAYRRHDVPERLHLAEPRA